MLDMYIETIKEKNGKSGRMYNEKYLKNNYPEIYDDVIKYCQINLNNISFKEKVYHYVNDIKEKVLCSNQNCHNEVKFKNSTLGYHKYCSMKCISSDPKIKDIKEKKSYEKYGTKSPGMNSDVKLKMIRTNNERYGGNSPMNNKSIKNKSQKTLLKNYGVSNPSKSLKLVEKRVITFSENMRNKYLEIYKEIGLYDIDYKNKKMFLKCDKGHDYSINLDLFHNRKFTNTLMCIICNPIDVHTSGQEIQLQNFIKEIYKGNINLNSREILNPYEVDVYLPELKIGFEFNGLFYHCEKCVENDYHLKKTELSEKNRIRLIQIYEDDWTYKQEIIKSRILNLLKKSPRKIFARKCEIREITNNNQTKFFLDQNHLQGNINSIIKLGLFYDEEMVSLMTFGKNRISLGQESKEGSYEMTRFCSKNYVNVVGGAGKLFKYFVDKYKPIEITSYADRSWSNGNLYEQLGFDFVHKTRPNYFYIVNKMRKNRFGFRKDILVKEGFDSNKTEHEIMLERKIYRIYDSGSLKFKLNL
jgi:hypothetical protein